MGRSRGKTIDDDAVPHTLKSPAKIVALRESKALEHSRSSSDLRAVAEGDDESAIILPPANVTPVKALALQKHATPRSPPIHPSLSLARRRSTLDWANASPQARQQNLEDIIAKRMADVFFSLHVEGIEGPMKLRPAVVGSFLTVKDRPRVCERDCETNNEPDLPSDRPIELRASSTATGFHDHPCLDTECFVDAMAALDGIRRIDEGATISGQDSGSNLSPFCIFFATSLPVSSSIISTVLCLKTPSSSISPMACICLLPLWRTLFPHPVRRRVEWPAPGLSPAHPLTRFCD